MPQLTKKKSENCCQRRQHQTFNQQLPSYFQTTRTERRADRKLLVSFLGTHQQEVRDVRARDEQQQPNRKQQYQQRSTTPAHDLFLQRYDRDMPTTVFAVWTTIA
jgi:hypothetical protein